MEHPIYTCWGSVSVFPSRLWDLGHHLSTAAHIPSGSLGAEFPLLCNSQEEIGSAMNFKNRTFCYMFSTEWQQMKNWNRLLQNKPCISQAYYVRHLVKGPLCQCFGKLLCCFPKQKEGMLCKEAILLLLFTLKTRLIFLFSFVFCLHLVLGSNQWQRMSLTLLLENHLVTSLMQLCCSCQVFL